MLTTRFLFLLPAALLLIACPDNRGPAEKIGDAMEEAGEQIEDAVTEDGPVEEFGESIDEALDGNGEN